MPLPLLLTGAIVYAFDTEEEMLLSFRHFVQDLQSAQSALSRGCGTRVTP